MSFRIAPARPETPVTPEPPEGGSGSGQQADDGGGEPDDVRRQLDRARFACCSCLTFSVGGPLCVLSAVLMLLSPPSSRPALVGEFNSAVAAWNASGAGAALAAAAACARSEVARDLCYELRPTGGGDRLADANADADLATYAPLRLSAASQFLLPQSYALGLRRQLNVSLNLNATRAAGARAAGAGPHAINTTTYTAAGGGGGNATLFGVPFDVFRVLRTRATKVVCEARWGSWNGPVVKTNRGQQKRGDCTTHAKITSVCVVLERVSLAWRPVRDGAGQVRGCYGSSAARYSPVDPSKSWHSWDASGVVVEARVSGDPYIDAVRLTGGSLDFGALPQDSEDFASWLLICGLGMTAFVCFCSISTYAAHSRSSVAGVSKRRRHERDAAAQQRQEQELSVEASRDRELQSLIRGSGRQGSLNSASSRFASGRSIQRVAVAAQPEGPPNPTAGEIVAYARAVLGADAVLDIDLLYIAEEALVCPTPLGWQEHYDPERGAVYYVQDHTQQTQWTHPLEQQFVDKFRAAKAQRAAARAPEIEARWAEPPT